MFLTITFFSFYFHSIDASEIVYEFSRKHEFFELDELLLTLSFTSILLVIFLIRRYTDFKKVVKKSNVDYLLKIFNRGKGVDLIKDAIIDTKNEYSLIMFDIDFFKKVNDTYGHDIGDEVLKDVILITQKLIRKDDMLIRWGGEEFILLCPKTTKHNAFLLAERCRKTIEINTFVKDIKITASFGVTDINHYEDLREQINRVDTKLYVSKNNGKNSVT